MVFYFWAIRILFFLITILFSQPDSRFQAFDWVLYKGPGKINSITDGYTYAYIGTEKGGIKRFNQFSLEFDDPITTAQGLMDNNILAVHFNKNTGIIWAASPSHIQYSYSREGDWFAMKLEEIGLSKFDKIKQIGSSKNYLWIKAQSSYAKLSQSSGTLVGIYPIPDEQNIEWSSGNYFEDQLIKTIINKFTFMDNWIMNDNQLIDPLGRYVNITTGWIDGHQNVFLGTADGSFFHGSNSIEIFYPIKTGLENIDVSSLFLDKDKLWIGSSDHESSKGISWFNISTGEVRLFEFDGTINMSSIPIYGIDIFQSELWASGEGMALFQNTDKNYWRTYGDEIGLPNGKIWDVVSDSSFIWFASSKGISRIDRKTQRKSNVGIESIYDRIPVYDLDLIEDNLWIGSRSGLHIFNVRHPQLKNAEKIGQKFFPEPLTYITAINNYDGVIYVAGSMGVAKFDKFERKWDLVFPAAFYHDEIIYSMKIQKNQIFLGTKKGLLRINLKTGFVREYFFSFIGHVNDIVLDNNIAWLGTSNGLIKFKWKRDL